MSGKFDKLIELRAKGENMTELELAVVTLWREMIGYESLAADAATELAALTARVEAADAEAAKLRGQLYKSVEYWDNGSPNFQTNNVEFPFEVASEINTFMNGVRKAALQESEK